LNVENACNHDLLGFRDSVRAPASAQMIDLFCGSGGMSLGFAMNGYRLVGGADIDEVSVGLQLRTLRGIERRNGWSFVVQRRSVLLPAFADGVCAPEKRR
jgi:ribosomal protein L11 methylase PrmA